jgi:hypothetical protein
MKQPALDEETFLRFFRTLDERQARLCAAERALAIGRGGITLGGLVILGPVGMGSHLPTPRSEPGVRNCRVDQPLLAFTPTDPGVPL